LTSITLRLNLANDEKSTVLSLGKLFHTLITLSEKNDDLTLLVQCRLESVHWWPLNCNTIIFWFKKITVVIMNIYIYYANEYNGGLPD